MDDSTKRLITLMEAADDGPSDPALKVARRITMLVLHRLEELDLLKTSPEEAFEVVLGDVTDSSAPSNWGLGSE